MDHPLSGYFSEVHYFLGTVEHPFQGNFLWVLLLQDIFLYIILLQGIFLWIILLQGIFCGSLFYRIFSCEPSFIWIFFRGSSFFRIISCGSSSFRIFSVDHPFSGYFLWIILSPHSWRCPRNSWMWPSGLWAGDKAGIRNSFPISVILGLCSVGFKGKLFPGMEFPDLPGIVPNQIVPPRTVGIVPEHGWGWNWIQSH